MEVAAKEPDPGGRDWIDTAFSAASGVLMVAISAIVVYCVVARYLFNAPPIWSEDVPRLLFVWMTYLAAVVVTRREANIKVTFLVEHLPRRAQLAIDAAMTAMVVAILLALAWYSLPVIELNIPGRMLSTGWSEAVFYLPVPGSCLLMALYQARRLARLCRELAEEG